MKYFVALFRAIDHTTSTKAKIAAIVEYFGKVSPADAAWATYFLSGRREKRLIGPSLLRQWLSEESELPHWLVDETYTRIGDLAETIALLLADTTTDNEQSIPLSQWVEEHLITLRDTDESTQRELVTSLWRSVGYDQCFITNKLVTGALRVGVSQLTVARAIAEHTNLPRALILHRMMGDWHPSANFWEQLTTHHTGEIVTSRPYPFCLASPLESAVDSLGDIADWHAEWKWDGIRAQLIRREGESYLWSRGEELINQRFPEIIDMSENLPDGSVIDGEILAWNDDGVMPFSSLQTRIGRKSPSRKLILQVPCRFMAYDVMEHDGQDLREQSFGKRRQQLEQLVHGVPSQSTNTTQSVLDISEKIKTSSWQSLNEMRSESRDRRVEGMMLKHKDAKYHTGRKRGHWWKWKIDPYTVDAIMMYAQAGHGRRANLYTDYTFGVWHDGELLPIAKAYSGLDNKEIARLDKWIRKNTIEKFGPVRSIVAEQVFELAFEGISLSKRHKSGVAVRFPRIARWREDLSAADADSLDTVKRLIQ